jgi:PAS domain S-box-containing protein
MASRARSQDATLLLVEDNPITRKMIRVALAKDGHRVLEAPDVRTALAHMASGAPDLVLQDLRLPDMDGLELLERLRSTKDGQDIPILGLTGLVSKREGSRMLSAGFDEILLKPVDLPRLTEAVRKRLRRAPTSSRGRRGRGHRVIVADDEPVQRKLAVLWLEGAGFVAEPTVDGEEALARARASPPDVILADVLMARLDGFKLCWAVRNDPGLARVPVVLISSKYVEEADRQLARDVGASALVGRTPEMQEAIEALLGSLEMKPPPPEPRRKEDVEAQYMQRVVRQLERQAALNTSLLEDQARKATSLTVLSATAEALSRRSDLKTALRDPLYCCLDAAGLSTGAVYLSSPQGGLRLEAQVGLIAEGRTRELPSLSDLELLPQVLASGKPVTVSSEAATAEVASDLLRRLDATSALVVPFGAATNARGLLLMASRSRDLAASDCLPFAQTLAAQFGQALALTQAFDQAASSGKRYRALVEHANDGISVLSTDGLILEVNRRMEDILGVPRERAVGRHISEFVPGDEALESVRRFHETAVGGGGRLEKVALQRADGTLVEVDFSISTTEIDGQPCVLSIGRDVTERRRAEEVLVERARLSSFAADVNMALTRSEGLGDMLDGCTEAMVRHLDAALARIWTLG